MDYKFGKKDARASPIDDKSSFNNSQSVSHHASFIRGKKVLNFIDEHDSEYK